MDDEVARSPDLTSNQEPARIAALADVAFRSINRGRALVGVSRADFVGLLAEFTTDLLLLAPFAYGNGVALRLLLTLLGDAVGRPIAFRGATRAGVQDAHHRALEGDPSSLIQLLDAALRPPVPEAASPLPSAREVLLSDLEVSRFAVALAARHGVDAAPLAVDAFASAVSRLSDAEAGTDATQDLLTALGRTRALTGHDVTMLLAAHLRQQVARTTGNPEST